MTFGIPTLARYKNFWHSLTVSEMSAAIVLGWNAESWEEGYTNDKYLIFWYDLNETQKLAVRILGYSINDWNTEVINEKRKQSFIRLKEDNRNNWNQNSQLTQDQVFQYMENFTENATNSIDLIEIQNNLNSETNNHTGMTSEV